jgi:CRP-like cAMP-binding protein
MEQILTKLELLRRCAPGTLLFREGEDARGVFVLHEGKVDLLFATRAGNVKPLRLAEPGQILGLSSVVGRRPYDCSAKARTPCLVGFIDRDVFLRVLEDNPAVWFSVLRILSNEVNAVYHDMRTLAIR